MAGNPHDPRADPDVPAGMSVELLQDLHLLTRDGHLNADARRKLKQIRHFLGLLRPALDDSLARHEAPVVVDCGSGKSALGFLIYELVLGPVGRGSMLAVETRAELVQAGAARAHRAGRDRGRARAAGGPAPARCATCRAAARAGSGSRGRSDGRAARGAARS